MKLYLKTIICIMCLILISSLSFAENSSKQEFTLSFGGSYVAEHIDSENDNVEFDESYGLNIKAGYKITKTVFLELDYLYLDGFDGEAYDRKIAEVSGSAITLNGKFSPITGNIQPYALLGLGIADLDVKGTGTLLGNYSDSDSDLLIRFGFGVDFSVTETVSLFGEVTYCVAKNDLRYFEDIVVVPITAGVKFTL